MNESDRRIEFEVVFEDAGRRFDVTVAAALERAGDPMGRAHAKRLIASGDVLVDGQRVKPGQTATVGQRVVVRLRAGIDQDDVGPDPSGWAEGLRVLFEDPELVVIDKAPGMAAHPADSSRIVLPNVAQAALVRYPDLAPAAGEGRAGIVHRLDRETSGVMVLARGDAALHALKGQFKGRTVEKEYRAIVFGTPRFDSDWIERAMQPHPRQGDKMVVVQEGGKPASTLYVVEERFDGFAHVRCHPKTGRTHQIRVHLTSIGHSLIGDRVYVSRNAQQRQLPEGAPDPGRHCLHARRLTFDHPRTGERMSFEATMPVDMANVLAWLRSERPVRD